MAGLSDLPVLALLLEFSQGLMFQFRRQQFIGGPLDVVICLPDPTDIVRGVPLRDMSNPYKPARPAAPVIPSCNSVGLTVRIEINLPAGGDKETYDAIFQSIKENLLNGNSA